MEKILETLLGEPGVILIIVIMIVRSGLLFNGVCSLFILLM